MQNVITNAWRGDPYRIDTLLIFMANMAWNATMNTSDVRQMLNDKHVDGDKAGEYKIPFLVVLRRLPVRNDRLCRPGAA